MKPIHTFFFFFIIVSIAVGFVNMDKISFVFSKKEKGIIDSIPENIEIEEVDSISLMSDTLRRNSFLYMDEADNSLNHFFNSLNHTNDSLVRVVYYGDSQIEGDHITYKLRQSLQARFGGSGIGYMPFEMYYNTTENLAIITNDFEKSIVSYKNNVQDTELGIYGRYFTPQNNECVLRIVNREKKHIFNQIKIIYSGESNIEIENGILIEERLLRNEHIGIDTLKYSTSPDHLKLKFKSLKKFKAYGFLFDSDCGIAVDDVSFRGNLNLMVNHFSGEHFKTMGDLLNPSLVILQFGLNVIPDQRLDYESYRIAVERDIQLLKKYLPNCSFLIIGVSDMAHKLNGKFESYSNIKLIIEAQRKAAINEAVAFWDLRSAMGGEGSIIDWVDKGLARTDYAHMTFEGTQHIGKLLNLDLMEAYKNYLMKNE